MLTTGHPARIPLVDGSVDLVREIVVRGARPQPLTTREVELLAYLAAHPDECVSRERLQVEVWGYSASVVSRTVDTTVRRLRTKIEADPAAPRHLHTVHGEGYRFRPAERVPLPVDWFGRNTERAQLEEALQRARVVGVVGPAGAGKSRLVRETLRDRPGVTWCHLAGVPANAIASRIVAAARVSVDDDPDALVGALLAARGGVWVLDGAVALSADRLNAWASRAGHARIVWTGRERLGVPATWVEVGPLDEASASAMFLARARAVDPTFDASPGTVAAIVERLDHLPGALELAAERCHVVGPEELLRRLARPSRVLGTALSRAVEEAWRGSSEAERRLWLALAVFEGPCTLEAVEAVAGEPVLESLRGLRDRSLVVARRTGDHVTFRLPHGVREHALDPAVNEGVGSTLAKRHAAFHVRAARAWVARLDGPEAAAALHALRGIRADLEAALMHVGSSVVDGTLALDALLEIDGPVSERVRWLDRALDAEGGPSAALLRRRAEAARVAGDSELALRLATEAHALAEGAESPRAAVTLAWCAPARAAVLASDACEHPDATAAVRIAARLAGAIAARSRGDAATAESYLRRAWEEVRVNGAIRHEAAVLANLATVLRDAGSLDEAERLYRRASDAARALGQTRICASALHNLGGLLAERGDVDGAILLVHDALTFASIGGEVGVLAHVRHTLGHLLHRAGRLEASEEAYVGALATLRTLDPGVAASAQGDLGALLADRGLLPSAEIALAEALQALPPGSAARATWLIHRAHLDVAYARASRDAVRTSHLLQARQRVTEACVLDGLRCRMAVQLLETTMEGLE